jgi:hypothetical protein
MKISLNNLLPLLRAWMLFIGVVISFVGYAESDSEKTLNIPIDLIRLEPKKGEHPEGHSNKLEPENIEHPENQDMHERPMGTAASSPIKQEMGRIPMDTPMSRDK